MTEESEIITRFKKLLPSDWKTNADDILSPFTFHKSRGYISRISPSYIAYKDEYGIMSLIEEKETKKRTISYMRNGGFFAERVIINVRGAIYDDVVPNSIRVNSVSHAKRQIEFFSVKNPGFSVSLEMGSNSDGKIGIVSGNYDPETSEFISTYEEDILRIIRLNNRLIFSGFHREYIGRELIEEEDKRMIDLFVQYISDEEMKRYITDLNRHAEIKENISRDDTVTTRINEASMLYESLNVDKFIVTKFNITKRFIEISCAAGIYSIKLKSESVKRKIDSMTWNFVDVYVPVMSTLMRSVEGYSSSYSVRDEMSVLIQDSITKREILTKYINDNQKDIYELEKKCYHAITAKTDGTFIRGIDINDIDLVSYINNYDNSREYIMNQLAYDRIPTRWDRTDRKNVIPVYFGYNAGIDQPHRIYFHLMIEEISIGIDVYDSIERSVDINTIKEAYIEDDEIVEKDIHTSIVLKLNHHYKFHAIINEMIDNIKTCVENIEKGGDVREMSERLIAETNILL